MASKNKNWIQSAINPKNKGSLRKAAGVKEGETIPVSTLNKLAKSKNPVTAKRANLAKTLRSFKKGK